MRSFLIKQYSTFSLLNTLRLQKRDFLLPLINIVIIIILVNAIIIYYQLKVAEKVELGSSFVFCNLPRNDFNHGHNVVTRKYRKLCIVSRYQSG